MKIGIIGLGLIGGSMAIGLRKSGFASSINGVDFNPENAETALSLGLVDAIMDLETAVKNSDVIIIATPVNTMPKLVLQAMEYMNERQVVMDVGSTKMPLLEAVRHSPLRSRFVAAHPMAGTEYSGPEAAVDGLFTGKCCVLCETSRSAPDAVAIAEALFTALEMRLTALEGAEHDLHTAYVSHISHIASFALALTVLEKEREEDRIFDLASGGFSSTVRLAKSNPDTWTPIFEQNRDNVLDVLDEFINSVSRFRTLLIKKDFQSFHQLIEQANEIRRIIG
jgi:prephenate dehydrogenase